MPHYHKYRRVSENSDGIVEVCVECKKKLTTKVDRHGRIDNAKYLKEHAADFAQRTGATAKIYEQVYGNRKN